MASGLFDEFGLDVRRFGEVEAGDLEAVEEEAGAFPVSQIQRSLGICEEQLFLTEKLRQKLLQVPHVL